MEADAQQAAGQALGRIPQGYFIMTSHYEHRVGAAVVSWVQQVGFEPPMVVVSIRKGRPITPLILDSHTFALCQVMPADRPLAKGLAECTDDLSFDGVEMRRGQTGSPILLDAQAFLDCKVARHFDIDGDHDLYIGEVVDGGVLQGGDPFIHLRDDGFKY